MVGVEESNFFVGRYAEGIVPLFLLITKDSGIVDSNPPYDEGDR